MSVVGKGRIIQITPKAGTLQCTIPAAVAKDSAFPFEDGEVVKVSIDMKKNRVIIERVPDEEKDV